MLIDYSLLSFSILQDNFQPLQDMISIENANIKTLNEFDLIRLYKLMIKAYAETELEIWGEDYERLSYNEFVEIIKKEELFIARMGNEIVGSIHVFRIDNDTFSFGLLNSDFDKKGLGIGSALVDKAEEIAIKNGVDKVNIEVLRPSDFEVPVKVMLTNWYLKKGYTFTMYDTFINLKPDKIEKSKALKVPSGFDCYTKSLI